MVMLREIDASNRTAVESLRVSATQDRFVDGVTASLQEAVDDPDGHAQYWAIYEDDSPVGFVMISDAVDTPGYISQYLWRLLIDERFQGRGFGTATLDLIAAFFRDRGVDAMWTSAGQGEGSPVAFYERYGFVRTGELVFDDELLLRLDL